MPVSPGASGMQRRGPCRPWRGTLASGHKPRCGLLALQSLESNPQLSFATRMEDWTCLGQHKRHPEFPVAAGRESAVPLSRLEDEFYTAIPGIKSAVFQQLLRRRYYDHRPDSVQQGWMAGGAILGVIIAGGGIGLAAKFLMTPV